MNTHPASSVALDFMGAEKGTAAVTEAIANALEQCPDLPLLHLVGQTQVIERELSARGLLGTPRLSIHEASEIISMEDKPKEAYKTKKDSSMLQAIQLVKDGKAGAAVSCGNTGALLFSSTMMLRKVKGIERPALGTVMPGLTKNWVFIDAGAEPNTSARQLALNGVMGGAYCQAVLGVERPRVGLLSIGTEEGKGTERVSEAHELLKKFSPGLLDYTGLIEGFDLFNGRADVVVTDGFTGNVLLKSMQGFVRAMRTVLKQELTSSWINKLGALICKSGFKRFAERFNPSTYAGAPLLGLNGLVLKTHGSSDSQYITSAIRIAHESLAHELSANIAAQALAASQLLDAAATTAEAAD